MFIACDWFNLISVAAKLIYFSSCQFVSGFSIPNFSFISSLIFLYVFFIFFLWLPHFFVSLHVSHSTGVEAHE